MMCVIVRTAFTRRSCRCGMCSQFPLSVSRTVPFVLLTIAHSSYVADEHLPPVSLARSPYDVVAPSAPPPYAAAKAGVVPSNYDSLASPLQ
jgi:hypothetical protein